jgi:hypothetical protein
LHPFHFNGGIFGPSPPPEPETRRNPLSPGPRPPAKKNGQWAKQWVPLPHDD